MPMLALVVSFTLLISGLLISPLGLQEDVAKTGIGAILLAANFVIANSTGGYFDAPARANPLLHTWSLSVEEQFYLIFPTILILGYLLKRRVRSTTRGPSLTVATLTFFSLSVASISYFSDFSNPIFGFFSSLNRAWEFAIGALLFLNLDRLKKVRLFCHSGISLFGFLLLASSAVLISSDNIFPGPTALAPVMGTLLLLLSGSTKNNLTRQILGRPILVKLGDLSYSLYLWHWPILVFAGNLYPNSTEIRFASVVLSLALSVTSLRYFENPIRRLDNLKLRSWLVLLSFSTLLPIFIGISLIFCNTKGWWSDYVIAFRSDINTNHIGQKNGCDLRTPFGELGPLCRFNLDSQGKPVYLLGDSNADHFSEGIIQASKQIGRPVYLATTNGCPFVYLTNFAYELDPSIEDSTCTKYVEESLANLNLADSGTVVISNTSGYWKSPTNSEEKFNSVINGLEIVVTQLENSGHEVILVKPIPHWDWTSSWDPFSCTLIEVFKRSCVAKRALGEAELTRSDDYFLVSQVSKITNASAWNPLTELCPKNVCSTYGPGFQRYRDYAHLSVSQSKALTGNWLKLLSQNSKN